MPSYYPITVVRSDGQSSVKRRDGTVELNQPTEDQLDQKVQKDKNDHCKDFYRKVPRGSEKDIDWRRKLGGMLIHLAGSPEQLKKQWILDTLPENYTLWEHVKHAVDQNGDAKKSDSTHAAGGMERQDAYLYGHPQGRKKRYRSPSEFFEHLLWLATDQTGNKDNCACKICDHDNKQKEQTDKSGDSAMPDHVEPLPLPKPATTSVMPSPAPPPRSREQSRDRDANSVCLYRLGELVWFSKGRLAWGLGIIAKRQEVNSKPRYLLQPLSNPLMHAKSVIINEERDLRPWLAWSVPNTTHTALANSSFETVPWENVINGELGPGDAEVDGSILASKDIDISYSFFGRIESPQSVPGEIHWNAMFLGAEKIWVGEPVRLRAPNDGTGTYVMIVHQLIEKTSNNGGSSSTQAQNTAAMVTIIGDVYKFITSSARPADTPHHLPIRMTADLRFRNQVARNASRSEYHSWTLIQASARRSISDLKGRWYETRRLLPTLMTSPEEYRQAISQGNTFDVGQLMNGRGDSTEFEGGRRRKNRRDTLGKSVPDNFAISRGMDSTDAKGIAFDDNLFPEDGGQDGGSESAMALDEGATTVVESDLEQFMNLDDAGVGFYGDTMSN